VVFERGTGGLFAFPFSLDHLEKTATGFRMAEMASLPSVADDGTLLYLKTEAAPRGQIVWVDRAGKIVGNVGGPIDGLAWIRLSPDEESMRASMTAKVTAINAEKREVTLKGPDGKEKTLTESRGSRDSSLITRWRESSVSLGTDVPKDTPACPDMDAPKSY
jgi:hypothetical protein